jgi:hypothetical protein
MVACIVLSLFVIYSASIAQEKSDEDLKKKYEPILGKYWFDYGGEAFYLDFHIKEGELWADSGDGRPAVMEPAGEGPFGFKAEDAENGIFEIVFLKDEQGKYMICHVVNMTIGLDIKGNKKEQDPN